MLDVIPKKMAVWQYKAELVPTAWLVAEFGEIPPIIPKYGCTEDEEYTDYDFWSSADVPSDLVATVGGILPPMESWSDDALMFGNVKEDDICLWYDSDKLESIYFRLDIRRFRKDVLEGLTSLANALSCKIISSNDAGIIEPEYPLLVADIKRSDAYKFCRDPEGFLRGINQKPDRG